MAELRMERQAKDNNYLHKDFHKALNRALIYLEERHGCEAVTAYLEEFANSFYAPLRLALLERGLDALHDHFQRVYAQEGGDVTITRDKEADRLSIRVHSCPAVSHIRAGGDPVSGLFALTHSVINASLCQNTPYRAELIDYQPCDGACLQLFTRREHP